MPVTSHITALARWRYGDAWPMLALALECSRSFQNQLDGSPRGPLACVGPTRGVWPTCPTHPEGRSMGSHPGWLDRRYVRRSPSSLGPTQTTRGLASWLRPIPSVWVQLTTLGPSCSCPVNSSVLWVNPWPKSGLAHHTLVLPAPFVIWFWCLCWMLSYMWVLCPIVRHFLSYGCNNCWPTIKIRYQRLKVWGRLFLGND